MSSGLRSISRVNEFWRELLRESRFVELSDFIDEINSSTPRLRTSRHHAWVTIIYGCNKFCSYCIVPYTRGREKSRSMEDILNEVKRLASKGYREVTYLGQNVDSYGKDLADGSTLAKLIRETLKIEQIERIWYLTSYPKDFSDELIDVIASSKRVSRSIHLPIQSGSNRILKAMNRGYTREEYLDLIRRIRTKVPDASISTDIIVGFRAKVKTIISRPNRCLKRLFFERVNLAIYSPREGTISAKYMKDDVPHEIKVRRLQELLELQKCLNRKINSEYIGKTVEIIVEARHKDGMLYGRTINNKIVFFHGSEELIGSKAKITIEKTTAGPLYGQLVENELITKK